MSIKGALDRLRYWAWDTANNEGKTGDAANHTLRLDKDGTVAAPAASPFEVDATYLPGMYAVTLNSSEQAFDTIALGGISSTDDVSLIGPINVHSDQSALATIDTVVDAVKAKTDSLTFSEAGKVDSNVKSISDDSTAADNLESVLDGNGITNDVDLTARSLKVENDTGDAVEFKSTSGGVGLKADGDAGGIYAQAINSGHGVRADGKGGSHGIYGLGGDTGGNGILGEAYTGQNASGIKGVGKGTGDGLELVKGASGKDINADEIDNILTDTNEMQGKLPTGNIAGADALSTVDTVVDAIKATTDNLPNSGSLTDISNALTTIDTNIDTVTAKLPSKGYLTGTNNSDGDIQEMDMTGGISSQHATDLQTKIDDRIAAYKLNQLAQSIAGSPATDSYMDQLMNKDGSQTFNKAYDSLEAQSDRAQDHTNALTTIDTNVDSVVAKLPSNYMMGSSDQSDKDDEIDAIKTVTDNLPNSGALTDISNALTTIDTVADAVQAKTDQLSFTSGNVDANAKAISDSTGAADNVEANIGNLDAAVSSRSDFDESTDNVNLNADQSGVTVGTVNNIGSNAVSSIDAELSTQHGSGNWDATATTVNLNDNDTNKGVLAEAIRNYDASGITVGASSIEKAIQDNIDANETKIDTVDTVVDAIKAKTDNLNFNSDGTPLVLADVRDVNDAAVSTIDDFKADVSNLDVAVSTRSSHSAADAADAVWDESKTGHTGDLKTVADNVDQSLSTTESNIRGSDSDDLKDISDQLDSNASAVSTIDTVVDSIKSQTDQLAFTAGNVHAHTKAKDSTLALSTQEKADVNAEADQALADYDSPTRAEATSDKNEIITEVDANETKIDSVQTDTTAIKAKTDNLPADPASEANATTNTSSINTNVDANETKIDSLQTDVTAVKAITDNLPNSGALTDISNALTTIDNEVDKTKAWLTGDSQWDFDSTPAKYKVAAGVAGVTTLDAEVYKSDGTSKPANPAEVAVRKNYSES